MKDKINQLSDDVLVHILSFLTVKEAARTSILAKRWKDLWTYTTRLDFDDTDDDVADNVAGNGSAKWVNQALKKLDRRSIIDEFRVRLDARKVDQNSFKILHMYPMLRGAQRLELDLLYNFRDIRYFRYSCSFPGPLGVRSRAMLREEPYSNLGRFHYLRDFCLKCVEISGESLEWLMRNCPLLERIVVHGSDILVNLEVKGPSLKLKHLVICHCFNSKSIKVLDAINLVSIVVKAAGNLQVRNVPMLADVSVADQHLQEDDQIYVSDVFSRLSCCLSQLEVLTLDIGRDHIKKMELLEFPKLPKLKQLMLVAEAWHDESIIGITSLMIACPFLQKFLMKLLWKIRRGATTYKRRNSFKKATDQSPLQHLKVVEIFGYYGCANEIELLTYIWENATALKKIIIDPSNQWPFVDDPMTLAHVHSEQSHQREELLGVIPQHVELVIL